MRITSRKVRMGAPLTLGSLVVFQRFGVDICNVDSWDALDELKRSVDFVGYDVNGEYISANYTADIYKNTQNNYVFKGKENFEIIFDDSDDVSFI